MIYYTKELKSYIREVKQCVETGKYFILYITTQNESPDVKKVIDRVIKSNQNT